METRNSLWASSPLLSRVSGLCHGFTLRSAGDFADEAARRRLLEQTGTQDLRLLQQVHGVEVACALGPQEAPVADAWAGAPPAGTLLGIATADCLPVLLCHPPSGTLGLAHAGWRGATAGILAETLKAMAVPAEEVLGALGPCIGPCCYEVGEDVAAAAGNPTQRLQPLASGKYRFDLPGFAADQLEALGISGHRLDRVGLCTGCRTDILFSFRKEGPTGRLCSFLGWLPGRMR